MGLRPRSPATAWGRAFEGAFEAGISVAIGVVLGYYADRWLGTEPVFLFFFLIVGSIAGFRRLLRIEAPSPPPPETAASPSPPSPEGPADAPDKDRSD